ncbi:calcium:proton antiporter [Mesorhizobium sp. ES1-1]|uniref:calcium:proton antiporter n=1 Tax=Mesorhizobium sp. ES1-1 TaxID=2876629 RepID=UPI001CCCF2EA|nr:ionic transporter [Mesorhizobium sp. ES1-1]MBZ9677255.1 ionic transporter [Mesorhizobium sp. ES1-1]
MIAQTEATDVKKRPAGTGPVRSAMRLLPAGTFVLAAVCQSGLLPLDDLGFSARTVLSLLAACLVFVTVFMVLRNAEAVAHHVGEPYGTLVLTLAVTAIEVSVIISMMLHGENNPTLARESVFSTVMIVCTGVVGVCLTFGGWRHLHQDIIRQGTSSYLGVMIALTVLTLVLPNFTLTTSPGTFSPLQLAFVSTLSLLLYSAFVFAQTVRHRGDFVGDVDSHHEDAADAAAEALAPNIVLLVLGLTGIVLLTELIAGSIEDGLAALRVAQSDAIVGAFIATLVLMPEAVSAIKWALRNDLQRSMNVALGSACATIGLTIPAVSAASLITGRGLTLGLESGDTVLLLLALAISVISFGTGRTTVLTGLVHLVVFGAYLFLIFVP